ncbi:MAG: YeeE/YedE family protein [Candidatus Omnitrophica bacterium]|nr:YeeE/YedE family protein [Candidatus Omnitrophota bacterium]
MENSPKPYMNPYLAGVFLGSVLLASFLVLGAGLGASSGLARIAAALELSIAKTHTLSSEYFGKWGETPLNYYLVFMFVGTVLGGLFSALAAKRISFQLEKGKAASRLLRISFALIGGIIIGYASRLAQGCTSGQALTGGALLLTGSLVFLICLFAGGYLAAYFVRRQWND